METATPTNPYVGPRSLKTGEPFFGRDREIRSLLALLVSERIVMLHSPSGAGKSSLIQAGLMPRMTERFSVFPVIRVNLEPPTEIRTSSGSNRYVLSTLLSLEEGQPAEKQIPLPELAALTLDAYLEKRNLPEAHLENSLLIFDQFEEVLTASPSDIAIKQAFFSQLGEALQNRRRWALFAIREDYMGGLAPYVRDIPNRLSVTFRLGLLGPDAAKTAIQLPAKNREVDFTDDAAQKLVDDLRRIQVQQPDGSFTTEAGPSVEPVQLQVVCYNLWQSHAADDKIIDENDLQRVGSVDNALSSYYANAVSNVAEISMCDERTLRQWFDKHLITPDGIRTQVLKGARTTEGLDNIFLRLLENTHLIRGETRAGKTWYELSHDRLVKPIHNDNIAWFDKHLSLFQRQSILWIQQGRSEDLLLRGKALAEAERESRSLAMTQEEKDYIEACRKLREREQLTQRQERERRRNITLSILAVGAIIALVITTNFYFQARDSARQAINAANTAQAASTEAILQQATARAAVATSIVSEKIAKQQAQISLARQLAMQAQSISADRNANQMLATLFDIQSMKLFATNEAATYLLNNNLAARPIAQSVSGNSVSAVAFSPDGRYIVSGGCEEYNNDKRTCLEGFVRVWEPSTGKEISSMTLEGNIRTVAFSPDGQFVVSGGDDNTARVWESTTGKEITRLAHGGPVTDVVFNQDGRHVLTGSEDSTTRIWDTRTGDNLAFLLHTGGVRVVAYSPDEKFVLSGSDDDTTRIWDVAAKTELMRLSETGDVLSAAYSPNGLYVATGGADGTAHVWRIADGQEISRVNHGIRVRAVAFSPDGQFTLSAGCDELDIRSNCAKGSAHIWETTTGKEISRLDEDNEILSAAFSPDGKYVLTGSFDGTARLWRVADGQEVCRMTHDGSVNAVAFSSDGKFAASGSADKTTRTWAPFTERTTVNLAHDSDYIWDIAYSPDGEFILSGGEDDTARIWSVETNQEIARVTHDGDVRVVAFSQDGKYALSGSEDKTARIWEASSGKEIIRIVHDGSVWAADFSPDNQYIVSGGDHNFAHVWDVSTGQEISRMILDGGVWAVAFSPDGKSVATASADNTIRIWDTATGAEKLRMIHEGGPESVAYSPDGKYLISGSFDKFARVWDTTTGTQIARLAHDNPVLSVAFSPDSKYVITGSEDKTARIWELPTGHEVIRMRYHRVMYTLAVGFSADGKYAFSGSDEKVAHKWVWQAADLIDFACSLMPRNLTRAEWEKYVGNVLPYQAVCPQLPIEPAIPSAP